MKTLVTMAGIVAISFLNGCTTNPAMNSYISSGDQLINETVGPEYEKYVDNDPLLDALQRKVRHDNVDAFRKATEEAKVNNAQ